MLSFPLRGSCFKTFPILVLIALISGCSDRDFSKAAFSVIPASSENGSISPSTTQRLNWGSSTSFTITPDSGYKIANIGGTCPGTLDGNVFTAKFITYDCTVFASFAAIASTPSLLKSVIPSVIGSGTINPATTQRIEAGESIRFAVTAEEGNTLDAIVGTCDGTLTDNEFTILAIEDDCALVAIFIPESQPQAEVLTVIPSSVGNGTILPSTPQTIPMGEQISFTITPATGFEIGEIASTCGGSFTNDVFTTETITNNCSVVVSFTPTPEPTPFSVIPVTNGSGSITPNTIQTVSEGAVTAFEMVPEPGFLLSGVTGTCGGTLDGTTYTTAGITADCSVVANFSPEPEPPLFSVLPSASENGTISPSEIQTVAEAETFSFTLTPNPGYGINSVDGSCGGSLDGTVFTTAAITDNCTVIANFSLLPPPAPEISLSAQQTKRFSFSWLGVSNATGYRLLENPDGHSGYSDIAVLDDSTTNFELDVFLPERINASYILSACNSSGCTDSAPTFVTTSLAEATGYVKSSNTAGMQQFGSGIALSEDGRTMAIAAVGESSNAVGINGDQTDTSAPASGAVYVFTREGSHNSWQQQAYIKASNSLEFIRFGSALALSADGNTLVVSAPEEASNATGINGDQSDVSASRSGAVYVFVRSSNLWSQQAYIKASNTREDSFFGNSVALTADGNTLAVGAPAESSNATGIDGDQTDTSALRSGAVYLFRRDSGSNWSQQAYIKASNTTGNFEFGASVALAGDGSTLAVGSTGESSNATGVDGDQSDTSLASSGAVYVFRFAADTWSQQAYIKASNTRADAAFGSAVALSNDGNTLAVGARNEDNAASGINGDQDSGTSPSSGAVYAFVFESDVWSQQAYIKASNNTFFIQFGWSLALSADGDALVVGARQEGNLETGINGDQFNAAAFNVGAAYLFKRHDGTWSQQAYIKASNTAGSQRFGGAVAIAGDGSMLAVGAIGEQSTATGINGDQTDTSSNNAGAVYLF